MKKFAGIILISVLLTAVAIGIFVATFDANKFQPQIAEVISKRIGREVKINGTIGLKISWSKGFSLSVGDVSIANPSWASRPLMAKIGGIELGVSLPPLLKNSLEVGSIIVENADIQLETNTAGQSNWELEIFEAGKPSEGKTAEKKKPEEKSEQLSFHIKKIGIKNSRFAIRGKDGKLNEYKIDSFSFFAKDKGAEIKFSGEADGKAISLNITGQLPIEKIMESKLPFTAEVLYNPFTVVANGVLDAKAKTASLETYEVKAGESKINGQLAINYGGARPAIQGTLNSEKINLSDFKTDKEETGKETTKTNVSSEAENTQQYIFSKEHLNLEGLKAVDAKLEIAIGEIPLGLSSVKNIKTKLDLENGRLLLSPFKAEVAGTQAEGQIGLDAGRIPAQFTAILKAYQLDLAQFVSLSGLKSFLESKGDADMDITTFGNSMRDFAANANGQINLVVAGGSVSERVLGEIAGNLLNIFAPGTGNLTKPQLNCLAAHFKINNGKMDITGLLADTGQATVAGTGGVDLRDETIDMVLYSKVKGVEEINALAPPLRIKGPLKKPSYNPDVKSTMQKAVGILTGTVQNGVPEIIQQAGQNACEYTLRNPQKTRPAALPLPVEKAVEKARDKVKDLGNKALEGLGGLLGR